jgi:PAS domain-containing protein
MDLDDALLGAVAATVSDGVIARVAATGTTPRTAVEDLSGTRLDGFPIGRRLLANEAPIIAAEGEVSHATQTRIMQPIGARSLLAAAGRSRNVVRVVVSGYRSTDRPPGPAHLDAIEAVLAHAAANVVRIERSTQFAQVGAAVDEAILILGRNGDEVFSNDAARELLGSGSTDVRDRLRTLYTNEDGSDMDDLDDPIRHALAGEPVVGLVLRHRPTEAPHRVNVLPLAGLGAVITIRDISSDVAAATEAAPIADIIEHRERRAP